MKKSEPFNIYQVALVIYCVVIGALIMALGVITFIKGRIVACRCYYRLTFGYLRRVKTTQIFIRGWVGRGLYN